jgi:hypothetical protein
MYIGNSHSINSITAITFETFDTIHQMQNRLRQRLYDAALWVSLLVKDGSCSSNRLSTTAIQLLCSYPVFTRLDTSNPNLTHASCRRLRQRMQRSRDQAPSHEMVSSWN